MKTLTTLLSMLFVSISVFAFPNAGRLSVSTADNSFLRITIDGRYDKQGNSILVDDISTGYHNIKIYQARKGGWNNRNNNFDLVYSGGVFFKPMHHVDIVISRFGKVVMDERQIGRYDGNNRNNDRDNDKDYRRGDNRRYDYDNRRYDKDNNDDRYYRPMSNDMFRAAKEAICREHFDNPRMNITKQILSNNYLNASQVKELVQLFSFEDNKLDIAKCAYPRTVDKNYYFIVNDAFSFDRSKQELAKYIQNFR